METNKEFFKIATLQVKQNYANQNIIFGVNHREHGYTECRIKFSNSGNTDPGMGVLNKQELLQEHGESLKPQPVHGIYI